MQKNNLTQKQTPERLIRLGPGAYIQTTLDKGFRDDVIYARTRITIVTVE